MPYKYRDLTNQRFGKLVALERTKERRQGHTMWECLCDCGERSLVRLGDLTRPGPGSVRSCGCAKYSKGPENGWWGGARHVSGTCFGSIRRNAAARGIKMGITIEYVDGLLEKQSFRCALTGWPIVVDDTASLDRIDSGKGYEAGNVQWVHKDVNIAKNVFSTDHFDSICVAVVTYRKRRKA